MASISLLYSTDSLYNTAQTGTTNASQTTTSTQDATSSQDDTVKLSTEAQAKAMYKQGQNVATIAATLGTDTKTVDNYLGIELEKEMEKTLETTLSATA